MKTTLLILPLLLLSLYSVGQSKVRYEHDYCWKAVHIKAYSYIDKNHDLKWDNPDTIMQVAERITKMYKGKHGWYRTMFDFYEYVDLDCYYLHNKRIRPVNIIKRADWFDGYTGTIPHFNLNNL